MQHKILLGLTTTQGSDWKEKINEINRYNIKEIALFPTFLEIKQRKELYRLLEKSRLERIPHVHLRDDTESWELDYYKEKYKTKVFNAHAQPEIIELLHKNKKYSKYVYVENGGVIDDKFMQTLKSCAGVCLDIAHWDDQGFRQKNIGYDKFSEILKNYKIGCCHISAISEKFLVWYSDYDKRQFKVYSQHYLKNLSELDYVNDYIEHLPKYISIELENSFKKQLEVKKYLEKLINGADR